MKRIRSQRLVVSTTLILFGLIVAGCIAPLTAPESGADPAAMPSGGTVGLEGPIWLLVTYADASGATVDALPETEVTATFQDGEVGGNASCNQYFGTYEVNGASLTVMPGGMTMMACPPPITDQEQQYMANLGAAAEYAIEGDTLHILDVDGQVLLTYRVYSPAALVDTRWRLLRYNNGTGGMVADLTSESITALFASDSTVSGFAGCNDYSASYSVEGDGIEIGPAMSTQKACSEPEGVMETEMAYLIALQSAATFEIAGKELTLRDADGTPAVVYRVDETASTPLVGPTWNLLQYNNGRGGLTTDLTSELITAAFGDDGTLSGFSGCNDYSTSYAVDGDAIQIGPVMGTMKACSEPDGVMDTEMAYLAAMGTAVTYAIDGDELTLFDAEGTIALKYQAGSE